MEVINIDIEKIQYVLMRFSDKFVLKHVVKFSYKDKIGKRRGYHNVVSYSTNNYIDSGVGTLCNINIYFKSYLILECVDQSIPWELRQNLMITEDNIHRLIKKLKRIKKWFKSEKYDDLFYIEDDVLKLNKEMASGISEFIPLSQDKGIIAVPAVITDRTQNYEGIMLFINNKKTVLGLAINEINTLRYLLKKINLYESGLSLLSYMGKPTEIKEVFTIKNDDNSEIQNKFNNYSRPKNDEKMSEFFR